MNSESEIIQSSKVHPYRQSDSIFLRKTWYDIFSKHALFKDQESLFIDIESCFYDQKAIGLMPLIINPYKKFGSKSLQSMSNYYSPFYEFPVNFCWNQNLRNEAIAAVSQQLLEYDIIELFPLISEQADQYIQSFSEIGFVGHQYQYSINWYEDDIKNLSDYWSRRPSRLKNTLKRKLDKFSKNPFYQMKVVSPSSELELYKFLSDYHQVYFESWKRVEPYPAFIDLICEDAFKNNELRFGFIYYGDEPIAAQLWFVCGESAYIYKLAYNNSHKELSPGTLLTASLIEHVIEQDGVKIIDFLTGNDKYKSDWMSKNRTLYGIHFCNNKTAWGKIEIYKNTLSTIKKCLANTIK